MSKPKMKLLPTKKIETKDLRTEAERIVDRLVLLIATAFDDGYIAGQKSVVEAAVDQANTIITVEIADPTLQWTNELAKELVTEAFKPEREGNTDDPLCTG